MPLKVNSDEISKELTIAVEQILKENYVRPENEFSLISELQNIEDDHVSELSFEKKKDTSVLDARLDDMVEI